MISYNPFTTVFAFLIAVTLIQNQLITTRTNLRDQKKGVCDEQKKSKLAGYVPACNRRYYMINNELCHETWKM